MKKQVKLAILLLIITAAVAYGIFTAIRTIEVVTLIIEPRDATMYFLAQGHGVRGDSITIYPLASGEVTAVLIRQGEMINAGDIIAHVDYSELELAIKRSEVSISALEAQIDNLRISENRERQSLMSGRAELFAQLDILAVRSDARSLSVQEQITLQEALNRQIEASLERAINNYRNIELLHLVGAISTEEYNAADRQVEDAERALEQGELTLANIIANVGAAMGSDEYFEAAAQAINVQIAGIDSTLAQSFTGAMEDYYMALIEAERLNIEGLRRAINDSALRSPVSGRIERLYIQDSNIASPSMPAAYISTDDEISVEVFVRTRDVVHLQAGDEVEVIFRARSQDIITAGIIREIDDRAIERLSPLGISERSVSVKIQLPDKHIIRDGYDVDVRFVYYSEENRMVVPRTALFRHERKDMLWVVEDGRAAMREVLLGAELRIDTVVEAGITFGDIVIIDANDNRISEGVNVR